MNNADNSTEYVTALCDNIMKEIETSCPNMNLNERGKLESCLSGISSVSASLNEIIEYGVQQLKSTAIKPRINPWVDNFTSFSHQLTEVKFFDFLSYLLTVSYITRMNCLHMKQENHLYKH